MRGVKIHFPATLYYAPLIKCILILQGELIGFPDDLIHSFNKNQSSVHNSDYFKKLEGRHNVLLLGDSLGDLKMADGAHPKNILTVGFLNDKVC